MAGVVYLAGFRFEPAAGRLWRDGREIVLRPKTAAVLACLAGREGELVSKRELLRLVWPEGFVGESVLPVCVSELRRVFGDDPRQPRVIATEHRRGYRLVAQVLPAAPLAPQAERVFVGRAAALAALGGWWERAQGGRRGVGFVAASAGVGKTALVDAFAGWVREGSGQPPLTGWGQCVEQFGPGEAYLPVLQALAGLCRGPGGAAVAAVVRRCAPSWWAQLPDLCDDAELAALGPPAAGVPVPRMLRECAIAVEELTAGRPLLLVLEDLHAADRATTELIDYLARRRERARLLLVATYRPAELIVRGHPLHRVAQDLAARGLAARLSLELLAPAEVGAYLAARLAPRAPAAELVAEVHQRTEGNALFMVALTDWLLARGLLAGADGGVRARGRLAGLGMPGELRAMLEQQVDALDPGDRQLLGVAAAAGVQFAAEAVRAGLGEGCGLDAAGVEERCAELARRRAVLEPAGECEWPDGTLTARYRFLHEMYREVCYGRLGPAGRAAAHRGIGARLTAGYGDRAGEVAAELAVHGEAGRDWPAAVAHRAAAATAALGRSAYPQAVEHTRRGLGLLPRVADPAARAQLELRLRRAQAVAAAAAWGWRDPGTAANCRRLRELAVATGDTQARVTAVLGLHSHAMSRGAAAAMDARARELDALAGREPDPAAQLACHVLRLRGDSRAGRCAAVWEHARAMLALYRPAEHRPLALLLGEELDVAAHLYGGTALWQLGYPGQAREHAAAALGSARAHEVPAGLARALWFGAVVHLLCGDPARVRALVGELDAICAEYQLGLWRAGGVILDGWAAGALGDPAAGLAQLRRGMAAWAQVIPAASPFQLGLQAGLCLAARDLPGGLAAVRAGLAAAERTGDTQNQPELLRLRGELRLLAGEAGAAEDALRSAAGLAAGRQARSFQLRAVTSLARLWAAQGHAGRARAALGALYATFTEGHDTADLTRARALLAALAAADGKPEERP